MPTETRPPEQVWLTRFWANYTEHSCQFSYEQKHADDIGYARIVDLPETTLPAEKVELLPCPLCPDGGRPYYTKSVNGSRMIYVGCSQCGVTLKAALIMVTPVDEQPSKDIVAVWNTRAPAQPTPASATREETPASTATETILREALKTIAAKKPDKWAFGECQMIANRALSDSADIADRAREIFDVGFASTTPATREQGAPERVWLELERFPDGPEWNVTFRGLPPPAHRVNAVEYVHGDRHAKAIEGLRRLKNAAFTLHVNEKHKPDAFAVCMHPICHEACKSWNEATARAALHPE